MYTAYGFIIFFLIATQFKQFLCPYTKKKNVVKL